VRMVGEKSPLFHTVTIRPFAGQRASVSSLLRRE
jgi:hypothetical protein